MSFPYNLDLIIATNKLLKKYEDQKELASTEFLATQEPEVVSEELAELFILLLKHKNFFNKVAEKICLEYALKYTNEWPMKSLLFLLIFVLNEKNYNDVQSVFKAMHHTFSIKVLEFFLSENNIVFVAREGCRFFDKEYILENVIRPLALKEKLIKVLFEEIRSYLQKTRTVVPKKATRPLHNHLSHKKFPVPVQLPQRDEYKFKPKTVPKTTYSQSIKKLAKINETKDKNWEEALKLYRQAKKCPVRVAHLPPKDVETEKVPKQMKFVTPLPKFGKVDVKKTTTTMLREAAILAKEKEVACRKLEDLLNGAFDTSKIEAVEEEIRKNKEQQNVQDIERKHLEGLLTFEEAVLAKKKLIQANQEKMDKFKAERVARVQELLRWRSEEQEKMKQLVEKSQNIQKAAKDSEKRMIEEKQVQAKMVEYESKKLLEEAYKKREAELHQKMKLIEELHILHEVRMNNNINAKEYDPTECPNLGLLCEMPMAELQERLKMLKIQMREELAERRKAIVEEKKKKEEFMGNVREFIEQSRMAKPKVVPSAPPKLVNTPEIRTLRERLQQAREMRKGII